MEARFEFNVVREEIFRKSKIATRGQAHANCVGTKPSRIARFANNYADCGDD